MKSSGLVFTICLCIFSASVAAQKLIFVAEDLPPYHFINQHGEKDGALYQIVRALIRQAGITADIQFTPWARAYDMSLTQPNVIMIQY